MLFNQFRILLVLFCISTLIFPTVNGKRNLRSSKCVRRKKDKAQSESKLMRKNPMGTNRLGTNPMRPILRGPNPMNPNPMRPKMGTNPMNPNPMKPNLGGTNPMNPNPRRPNPMKPNPMRPNPMRPNPMKPNPMKPNPMKPNPQTMNPKPMGTEPTQPKPSSSVPSETTEPPTGSGDGGDGGDADSSMLKKMLVAINKERSNAGKPALCYNKKLVSASQKHSDHMARVKQMAHTIGSSTMQSRVKAAGFKATGSAENVAQGQKTVDSVMKGWMNSPGHKKNILGDYKFFGAGEKDSYWTQNFGSGSGEDCTSY